MKSPLYLIPWCLEIFGEVAEQKFPWAGAPCLWCVLPPIQREGASTVSLNHPLAARLTGAWSSNV